MKCRYILILMVTLLLSYGAFAEENNQDNTVENSQGISTVAEEMDMPTLGQKQESLVKDKAKSKNIDELLSKDKGYVLRLFGAILVVGIMGVAAYFLSKKILPSITNETRKMKIAETLHIGRGKAIHLLEIKGKGQFVIGASPTDVKLIAKLCDETDFGPMLEEKIGQD